MLLVIWRVRAGDRPIRFSVPAFWRREPKSDGPEGPAVAAHKPARGRIVVVVRIPHLNLPMPRLLDIYMARSYLAILAMCMVGLLGLFYIATFIDLVDKLFRGETTTAMLLRFFYFRTPQYVYWMIPMAVLVATLVTIGLMTKNSELMVMRACGISLYRAAAPLLIFGVLLTGVLALMQERVLVVSNPEADQLERSIRHWGPATTTSLSRRWIVGTNGEMYHYDLFDQSANKFLNLLVYHLDDRDWRLRSVSQANDVTFVPIGPAAEAKGAWIAKQGWTRNFETAPKLGDDRAGVKYEYTTFTQQPLKLDAPSYFKTDEPVADLMSYVQLREYTTRLQASGANVTPQKVALQRKIAFPFVTIVMTILAVPFAVSTGRHGAMYGVGIGIGLAIIYIVTMSLTGALGGGGVLPPALAAWAPNILFGAAALYLVLTVRT